LVLLNAMRLLWFERWNQSWLGRLETALAGACGRFVSIFSPVSDWAKRGWHYRRQIVQTGLLILPALYWYQGVIIVQLDEVAVAHRYGRAVGTVDPGLHFRRPPPFDRITIEKPGRVRTVEIGIRSVSNSTDAARAPIEWSTPPQESSQRRRQ